VLAAALLTHFSGQLVAAEDLPPLDCVISPYQVVDLASPVPGVLDKIFVGESDYIEQGEVAASLEAGVERASVVLAKARAAIESEVRVSDVNLDFDQRRKERMDVLYQKNTVSVDIKDEADREYNLSTWRLQQAQDLRGIRQLELLRAEEQLRQKTVRTPIAGFVLEQFKDTGEYVEDQPIMRIAQLDPLYVEAIVPIQYYSQIREGMLARVHPETSTQEAREAQVTVVDRVGDAASGTFSVRLTLPNPDYGILAGVKCSMQFSGTTTADGGDSSNPHQRAIAAATLPGAGQ
jgi:RND family efflux transporter MFP subunit